MFGPFLEPLPDEELATILREALRSGGGQITRTTECFMASVVAEHLVNKLAVAGVTAVRVPREVPLTD